MTNRLQPPWDWCRIIGWTACTSLGQQDICYCRWGALWEHALTAERSSLPVRLAPCLSQPDGWQRDVIGVAQPLSEVEGGEAWRSIWAWLHGRVTRLSNWSLTADQQLRSDQLVLKRNFIEFCVPFYQFLIKWVYIINILTLTPDICSVNSD